MITRLPNNAVGCNKMNKGQNDHRELSTRKIPRGVGVSDYQLEIGWHIPDIGMQAFGKFSFDLEALFRNGVITVNPDNQYIFTIRRIGDQWYLKDLTLP